MDTIRLEKSDDEVNEMSKKVGKFEKPKIKRPKRAFSFSEILARIEWYITNKDQGN